MIITIVLEVWCVYYRGNVFFVLNIRVCYLIKKIFFLVFEFVYMKYFKMNLCLVINKMNLFKIIILYDIGSVSENLG